MWPCLIKRIASSFYLPIWITSLYTYGQSLITFNDWHFNLKHHTSTIYILHVYTWYNSTPSHTEVEVLSQHCSHFAREQTMLSTISVYLYFNLHTYQYTSTSYHLSSVNLTLKTDFIPNQFTKTKTCWKKKKKPNTAQKSSSLFHNGQHPRLLSLKCCVTQIHSLSPTAIQTETSNDGGSPILRHCCTMSSITHTKIFIH